MGILVIRGGAIGDFILTLPAIRLLRMAFPEATVEILGCYPVIQLVEGRYYAQLTHNLNSALWVSLFTPQVKLDKALCWYFARFQKVINYLNDECLSHNLLHAGVRHLIQGSSQIDNGAHAAYQLAKPLKKLSLFLQHPAAHLFPSHQDQQKALYMLKSMGYKTPFFVMHPGSGGRHKNWPLVCWKALFFWAIQKFPDFNLICVGGEADKLALEYLSHQICSLRICFFDSLPLPILTGLLSQASLFVGQDSGISHIAAATGIHCILLYGPTNPHIWAPANRLVSVIISSTHAMQDLPFEVVQQAIQARMQQIR